MYSDVSKNLYEDMFSLMFMSIYREIDKSVKHQTSGNYPKAIHNER